VVEHVLAKDETGVRFSYAAHNFVTNYPNLIKNIPDNVRNVLSVLESAGFEAYMVGGCVRDLLMSEVLKTEKARIPKDWDITTNAKPEEIIALFEKTVYENTFGTVGICFPVTPVQKTESVDSGEYETNTREQDNVSHETQTELKEVYVTHETSILPKNTDVSRENMINNVSHETKYEIIEVTPYRIEGKYNDFRRPEDVSFSDKIEDDLKRRDFTVNAIAMSIRGEVVDLYEGIKDIENKILKAVGDPDKRFQEDALRLLRAVRFSTDLDFVISSETMQSIFKNSSLIKNISQERIRDEFIKIIMSKNAASGLVMLQKLNLLKHFIPELEEGIGCDQSGEHIYDVWNHLLHALQHAVDKNWPLEIRLSALFHDIGKPRTRRNSLISVSGDSDKNSRAFALGDKRTGDPRRKEFLSESQNSSEYFSEKNQKNTKKKKYTFYGHEVVGARMTKKIMERMKFPKKEIDLVENLVRNHMFFSDTEQITLSAVRRIIQKVSKEHIWDLMNVRECDRVGMKKVEAPYRLRKYFAMIDEALRDPISVKQLKVDGNYLIKDMKIKPGPRMGWILNALLEEVLEDPKKNTLEYLKDKVLELNKLSDSELKTLGENAKEIKDELEEQEVKKLHVKHGVRLGKGPDRKAGA
jgi:tRNA nucleotidyltransferase (CCA-adding enzyme)